MIGRHGLVGDRVAFYGSVKFDAVVVTARRPIQAFRSSDLPVKKSGSTRLLLRRRGARTRRSAT
jgi:hypothetical protein